MTRVCWDLARRRPVLATTTAGYLVAGTAWGAATANPLTVPYLLVVLTVGAGVLALDARVGLGRGLLAALALWGLLHLAGGLLRVDGRSLYFAWVVPGVVRVDQLVHAYGTGCAVAVAGKALGRWLPAAPRGLVGPLLVLVGAGVGGIGEIVEFAATRVVPGTDVGDFANNGWDLAFDLVGAGIVAGALNRRPRRPVTEPGSTRLATPGGARAGGRGRRGAAACLAGQASFLAITALDGVRTDGYSHTREALSRLGAVGSAAFWAQNAALVALGLGVVAFGVSVRAEGGWLPAVGVCLAAAGVGLVGLAMVPCSPGCPLPGGRVHTPRDGFHLAAGLAVVAAAIAAPIAAGARARHDPRDATYARWSLMAAGAAAVAGVAYLFAGQASPWEGLSQRAMLAPLYLWLLATASLRLTGAVGPAPGGGVTVADGTGP